MVGQAERDVIQEQREDLHRRHLEIGADEVVGFHSPDLAGGTTASVRHRRNARGRHAVVGRRLRPPVPLHSMSKVFTYALTLEDSGREAPLRRVGVEPSGDPFNSITFDEPRNRPHNPMVNAGALVVNLCRELSERFGLHVFADAADSRFGRVAQPAR